MGLDKQNNHGVRIYTKRIILYVLTTMMSWSISQAQTLWKQSQFVLGTFYDPPYHFSKKTLQDDSANFQLAKDANFNVLTGTQDDGAIDHSFQGMQWALTVAQRVGLFYLVSDNRIYEAYNHQFDKPIEHILVNQYSRLPKELQKIFYGFNLCDEPQYRSSHLENVSALKWFLEAAFPDKLIYINLAPSYSADQNWGGFKGGNRDGILDDVERMHYEKYLDFYIDSLRPAVVSFDHYPFFRNGDVRRDYFYNLKIIRQKSGGKPFWACPMTVDHLKYIDPQETHIHFMYFCPIAYGAKGLIAFTFWPPSVRGYRSSLFDRQGKKTNKYEIVSQLNLYITKVLAPIVMRVPNVGVYHVSSYPHNQQFIDDTIDDHSKFVASESDKRIMIGVFKNRESTFFFVVNKSLDTLSNVQIALKGIARSVYLAPRVIGFDQNTSLQYTKVNTNVNAKKVLSYFSIPQMNGGEGRLVQLQ